MPKQYRRRSARVLLLDSAERVLLLRCRLDSGRPELGYGWVTPGGGVHEGETLQQAAARELREETGLAVSPGDLGSPVAHAAGYAQLGWVTGWLRDDFFCYRVGRVEVDISGMNATERGYHTGYRWWTVDELAATADTIYPFDLDRLLADLLAGRIRDKPVRLRWHHGQDTD